MNLHRSSSRPAIFLRLRNVSYALLLPLTLSVPALRSQHLELTMNQRALLDAAAAPARFAAGIQPLSLTASSQPGKVESIHFTPGADDMLPDAPQPAVSESSSSAAFAEDDSLGSEPGAFQSKPLDARTAPKTPDAKPIASLYTKYIPPGWGYQPIHGREKLILGARDLYSPGNILAILASSGYSHLANSQPNYGVNSTAFGQRVGAIAIRETAQGIFTDGVFAVIFHQDPRYFNEGRQFSPLHRTLYSITRPLVVRTTNGTGSTINSSLLAGYAAAALLNNAYYPQINRNVKDTFTSYGSSIGGAALGFFVSEFTDDALEFLRLKHRP